MLSADAELSDVLAGWARNEKEVDGLILIGSRQKNASAPDKAPDKYSDWDFQIIVSDDRFFKNSKWLESFPWGVPQVYIYRKGILGHANKVTAIWRDGEADFVIIKKSRLMAAKLLMRVGLHHKIAALRRPLASLAVVIRSGFTFLYDGHAWEDFFQRVLLDIPDPRIMDEEIEGMALGYICDFVWISRKIARGELLAAQRMFHLSLMETNIMLLHELRLRKGQLSLPDARRAELIWSAQELEVFTVHSIPTPDVLSEALKQSQKSFLQLMKELRNREWVWPIQNDPIH